MRAMPPEQYTCAPGGALDHRGQPCYGTCGTVHRTFEGADACARRRTLRVLRDPALPVLRPWRVLKRRRGGGRWWLAFARETWSLDCTWICERCQERFRDGEGILDPATCRATEARLVAGVEKDLCGECAAWADADRQSLAGDSAVF